MTRWLTAPLIPRTLRSLANVMLVVSAPLSVMAKDMWWGPDLRIAADEIVTMRPPARSSGIGRLDVRVGSGAVVSDGGL